MMKKLNLNIYGDRAYSIVQLAVRYCWNRKIMVLNPTLDECKFEVLPAERCGSSIGRNLIVHQRMDNEILLINIDFDKPIKKNDINVCLKNLAGALKLAGFKDDEPLVFLSPTLGTITADGALEWIALDAPIPTYEWPNKEVIEKFVKDWEWQVFWIYQHGKIDEADWITIDYIESLAEQMLNPTMEGKLEDPFLIEKKKLTIHDFVSFFSEEKQKHVGDQVYRIWATTFVNDWIMLFRESDIEKGWLNMTERVMDRKNIIFDRQIIVDAAEEFVRSKAFQRMKSAWLTIKNEQDLFFDPYLIYQRNPLSWDW